MSEDRENERSFSAREEKPEAATGHAGHRERVRDRMRDGGAKTAQEHELLEYVLFGGIPYRDTKTIAYELLRRFSNLHGVITAPIESLMETKGMTLNAAVQIRTLRYVSERYERERTEKTANAGIEGVLSYMKGIPEPFEEACYVVKIAPNGEITGLDVTGKGTKNAMNIPREEIIRTALTAGSENVIVIHNHPSGTVDASLFDHAYTYTLSKVLRESGVNLVDHLIAFDKYVYSMKNRSIRDYYRGKE